MKHINTFRWLSIALFSIALVACNEDKGNYDYIDINKVKEIKNIDNSYLRKKGERLTITPELDLSLENLEDFDYTWYYSTNGKEDSWKILHTGKDLDVEITDPIGTPDQDYYMAFEAKNRATEIPYRKLFSLHVSGIFGRGYVALCETENGIEMDMLVWDANNLIEQYHNILEDVGSTLPRDNVKPLDLLIVHNDALALDPNHVDKSKTSVWLLTDKYTTRLKSNNFSWDASYDISNSVMAGSVLENNYVKKGLPIIAKKMNVGYRVINKSIKIRYYIYLEEAGKGNWYQWTQHPANYFFDEPMNYVRKIIQENENGKEKDVIVRGDRFEPASFVSVDPSGTVYYATDKNKFFYQPVNSNLYGTAGMYYTLEVYDSSEEAEFKFNDNYKGVVCMGTRSSAGYGSNCYAIVQQADDSYKYIEYNVGPNVGSMASGNMRYRAAVFPAGSGIERAKFVAAAPVNKGSYIYYVTDDNKVYEANIYTSDDIAIVKDITSTIVKDGYSEITAFKYMLPNTGEFTLINENKSTTQLYELLAVATYNSSKGKNEGGKLEFFTSNAIDGTLTKHSLPTQTGWQTSWTGLGKVVGLDFKRN